MGCGSCKMVKSIMAFTMMVVSIMVLFSSVSFAADRMAIIFQYDSNADFRDTIYSGAAEAAALYGYELDAYHVVLSPRSSPKRWFDSNVMQKRPKAIIVVDSALSNHTQDLIDSALRQRISVGVINGNLEQSYQGAAFKVGSVQADEGQLAGRYLSQFSTQPPLCITHVIAINNDKLRCQGLANGMGTSIYQLSADAQYDEIYKGVESFLSAVDGEMPYVVITNQAMIAPLLKARDAIKKAGLGDFNIGFVGQAGSQVIDDIVRQKIVFAVHDQPFFQGYWAISAMALRLTFKLEPQKFVSSGPMVVDRKIAQTIKQGQKIVTLNIKTDKRIPTHSGANKSYPAIQPLRLNP